MGRKALVNAESVEAAIEALRANGESTTAQAVFDKLGRIGSMGTVHKLWKKCLTKADGKQDSQRQLPPNIQKVIFTYVDQQCSGAREEIAQELDISEQAAADLADANERLTDIVEGLREELARVVSEKANLEGRVGQLENELTHARDQAAGERRANEDAQVELGQLRLRVEALAPMDADVRNLRAQCEVQRMACVRAEQAAAVLEAQRVALDSQVNDLKGDLAGARADRARYEQKTIELFELVNREREARTSAQRDRAGARASQAEHPTTSGKSRNERGGQATLWPGGLPDGESSSSP